MVWISQKAAVEAVRAVSVSLFMNAPREVDFL
eukprot:SAG31_NODE_46970_length_252_cov_0.679739_1_plen_31_part_01